MARIAVVEDNETIRKVVAELLRDEAHEVILCEPEEASTCVPAALPDVVLLDLRLVTVTGEEVYAALRADPRTATTPIVVISARDDAGRTAKRLGAEALLTKPFSLAELDAVLDAVLHHPHARLGLGDTEKGDSDGS